MTAGEDQTTIENQAISFNGNYTDSGILDTHTIKWEFGDGTVVENELNPTYTYTNLGTYTATLTVTDKDGGTRSDTLRGTPSSGETVAAEAEFNKVSGGGSILRKDISES